MRSRYSASIVARLAPHRIPFSRTTRRINRLRMSIEVRPRRGMKRGRVTGREKKREPGLSGGIRAPRAARDHRGTPVAPLHSAHSARPSAALSLALLLAPVVSYAPDARRRRPDVRLAGNAHTPQILYLRPLPRRWKPNRDFANSNCTLLLARVPRNFTLTYVTTVNCYIMRN